MSDRKRTNVAGCATTSDWRCRHWPLAHHVSSLRRIPDRKCSSTLPASSVSPWHFTLYSHYFVLFLLCIASLYALRFFIFFQNMKPPTHFFRTRARAPFLTIFLHLVSSPACFCLVGCTSANVLPFIQGVPPPAPHPHLHTHTHVFVIHSLPLTHANPHTHSFSFKPLQHDSSQIKTIPKTIFFLFAPFH